MIGQIHFEFESYGNKSFITYGIADRSDIDHVEMEMMRLNDITGILPFNLLQSDDQLKCCYDITSMAKLSFVYDSQMDKQKLFQILEQLALCMETAEDYMLDIEHFVLNPEFIFVNVGSMRVRLALVPQKNIEMFKSVTLRDFLRAVMNEINYDYSGNGGEFYINVSNYLNSIREVRPKDFRGMLYHYMGIRQKKEEGKSNLPPKGALHTLPRKSEHEQMLSNRFHSHAAATSEAAGFRQGRSMDSQSLRLGEGSHAAESDDDAREQKGETVKKGFLKKNKKQEKQISSIAEMEIPGQFGLGLEIPGQDSFGIQIPGKDNLELEIPGQNNLGMKTAGQSGYGGESADRKKKKGHSLFQKKRETDLTHLQKKNVSDMGGPIPKSAPKPVLSKQEPLKLKNPALESSKQQMADAIAGTVLMEEPGEDSPFLENVKTGNRVYLEYSHKSELRIGRNPDFVDYVIDNPTVGRVHIAMIHGSEGYFVIDVNSKNGTFIDRKRIQSNVEEPIKDGCRLQLGTEEFYFYTH